MIERCERTSERRSEWPCTLRVDFIVIQPSMQCELTSKESMEQVPKCVTESSIGESNWKLDLINV